MSTASMGDLRIPDGWTLEPLQSRDQVLLRTPSPLSYMATVDFHLRGFRSGLTQSGKFVGEKIGKRGLVRKKYEGRGWKQTLLDDAVAYLQEVLA